MKALAKILVATVVIGSLTTPAHAAVSQGQTKKLIKIKSFKAKNIKYLTTSANLDTTTTTTAPAPTPSTVATPVADPNSIMMAKLMELVKALVDSNSAALAAMKQPANSVITTVNPVITLNPTISSINQQAQSGGAPIALSSAPQQPSISIGHNEENEGRR